MSIVKRFFLRRMGDKTKSTDSSQSVSHLLSSTSSNGINGSYFEDRLSLSAIGTDNDDTTASGQRDTNQNKPMEKTPARLIGKPTTPQLRVPSRASPRRTPSPATYGTPRSIDETSIEVLEDKLRKLSEAALSSATLICGTPSTARAATGASRRGDKLDAELRHLDTRTRRLVTQALDANRAWQTLAAEIMHPDRSDEALFRDNDLRLLSGANANISPTDEVLKSWSTTGRHRPTIRDLYNLLRSIEQSRIASDLARSLGVTEDEIRDESLLCKLTDNMMIDAARLRPYLDGMYQLCFDSVAEATQNFSVDSVNMVGEGNFGCVYRVMIGEQEMAVKRFKNTAEGELFFREIKTLARLKHPNLLELKGVVNEGDERCIITPFMRNGNLERKLRTEVLPWWLRLRILRDVACALDHMHSLTPPIVHRDVKPANILLDDDMNALLGDFGLSREKRSKYTSFTQTQAGTPHYMSLEVFRGDVTVKSDMYSFGLVLLEILTGLNVFDSMREPSHITEYVDNIDAHQAVDKRLPLPPTVVIEGLFNLGISCKDNNKNSRPDSRIAKTSLQQYYDHVAGLELDAA